MQHQFNAVEADAVFARRASCTEIGHHIDRRIGQIEFSRQRRFGHPRHPDHIGAIALESIDFGRSLQPGALGRCIGTTIKQRFTHRLSGRQ